MGAVEPSAYFKSPKNRLNFAPLFEQILWKRYPAESAKYEVPLSIFTVPWWNEGLIWVYVKRVIDTSHMRLQSWGTEKHIKINLTEKSKKKNQMKSKQKKEERKLDAKQPSTELKTCQSSIMFWNIKSPFADA